jgi:multiple sugar transport system permease protein
MFQTFRQHRLAYLLILPSVVSITCIFFLPLILGFWLSFCSKDLTRGSTTVGFIGLRNYSELLCNPAFWHSSILSLIWTISCVIPQYIIGFGLALLLNREFKGRGIVRALLLLPWVIPIVSAGAVWRWMYNPLFGVLSYFLLKMRVIHSPIPWLSSPSMALISCIIVNIWKGFPFSMIVLLAGLQVIPKQLYEAAQIDGASAWKKFRYVTFPMLIKISLIVILFQSIWTFNDFSTIYLLTTGGPGTSTTTLPIFAYMQSFQVGRISYGVSAATIMFLMMVLFGIMYIKIVTKSQIKQ